MSAAEKIMNACNLGANTYIEVPLKHQGVFFGFFFNKSMN